MAAPRFDVLGIGNAIFDILAHVEDDFVVHEKLAKGSMRLVDANEIARLYADLGQVVRISGGSAGNTVAGVASLAGKAAFIGKVAGDEFGDAYRHDMRGVGVAFDTEALKDGAPTASRLGLVTPDGERTMNTFLGASTELGTGEIDAKLIAAANVTYLEGYLFDKPEAKQAFRAAADIASKAGRKTALTLSDAFCVDRHRDDFRHLVQNDVDILFANETEIPALFQVNSFEEAVTAVRGACDVAVLTRSADGSTIVTADETITVKPEPVAKVSDVTGAGDLYAAGFLYGLTRGLPLAACGPLGSIAAAEVISHIGARPETSLAELARKQGIAV